MQTVVENMSVPKLRFREFEGNWNLFKIKDFVIDERGSMKIGPFGSQLKRDTFVNNGFKVFGQENIFLNDFNFGDRFITEQHFNNLKSNEIKEGDFVISTMGTIGKCAVVPILKQRGIMDSHMIRLRLSDNITADYLSQSFSLFITKKQIKRLSVGGIMDGLSMGIINELKFFIPSLPEQQKIAAFLSSVDEKLQQLSKKKSLLKAYKKGVMQKIFSQELRFKDANGNNFPDWEEKKLGEVFKGVKGKGLSKDKLNNEGTNKCILYGELYTTYSEQITQVVNRTESSEGVKSLKGDLLVPCSTTTSGIDLANVTALNEDNVQLGGDISILRTNGEKISNVFYAYYLSNYKKLELAKYGQGTTIVHLYYSHFKNMKIDVLNYDEQQKIANFLSAIDTKIDLVSTQIEITQAFKKGLLQQMFV